MMLKSILSELNYKYIENSAENPIKIKSWDKKVIDEDFILEIKTGSSYSVGVVLNKKDNTFGFIADWWGIESFTGEKQSDFIDKITQKYAYNNILDKIKDKGYQLVSENVDEDKNIKLVLRKWQ